MMRIAVLSFCLAVAACASEPEGPKHKYHPATLVNDLFEVDQGMPVREVKKQDFFFKHCELDERFPHTTKAEYSCSSPLSPE